MRGAVLHAAYDVRVETRDDPAIIEPTDAIIRLAATCVCGSDLWPYRGIEAVTEPCPMGHEYVGIVEAVGRDVSTIRPRPVCDRLVLRVRQHLRELSRRIPDRVHPSRADGLDRNPGGVRADPARRRHPRCHPRRSLAGDDPELACCV